MKWFRFRYNCMGMCWKLSHFFVLGSADKNPCLSLPGGQDVVTMLCKESVSIIIITSKLTYRYHGNQWPDNERASCDLMCCIWWPFWITVKVASSHMANFADIQDDLIKSCREVGLLFLKKMSSHTTRCYQEWLADYHGTQFSKL